MELLQADQFSYVTMQEQKDLLQKVMTQSFSSARLG